jgi:hypothetical protein
MLAVVELDSLPEVGVFLVVDDLRTMVSLLGVLLDATMVGVGLLGVLLDATMVGLLGVLLDARARRLDLRVRGGTSLPEETPGVPLLVASLGAGGCRSPGTF